MREAYVIQKKLAEGTEAILKAQGEGKDTSAWMEYFTGLENRLLGLLNTISDIKLAEFEKQDFSIEVYSEVLKQTIWLCPDKEVAAQIKREDPEAVTYTSDELRRLIALDPNPESLKAINGAKEVLSGNLIQSIPSKEPSGIKQCA